MELHLVQSNGSRGEEFLSRAGGGGVMTSILISGLYLLETVGPVVHPSTHSCKRLEGLYLLPPQ